MGKWTEDPIRGMHLSGMVLHVELGGIRGVNFPPQEEDWTHILSR